MRSESATNQIQTRCLLRQQHGSIELIIETFLFQGHVGTTATKKIDVYLSMQSTQEKLHPMTVVTMANARVYDLIGLICWQYTCEGREPKLTLVEKSFLHMHPIEELDISTYSRACSVKVKLSAWLDTSNLKDLGAHKDL